MSEAAPTGIAPRPVTLFTGQWADLPFEDVARLAGDWGYDGLEIACWGDHPGVRRRAAAFDAAFSARSASTHETSDRAITKEGP